MEIHPRRFFHGDSSMMSWRSILGILLRRRPWGLLQGVPTMVLHPLSFSLGDPSLVVHPRGTNSGDPSMFGWCGTVCFDRLLCGSNSPCVTRWASSPGFGPRVTLGGADGCLTVALAPSGVLLTAVAASPAWTPAWMWPWERVLLAGALSMLAHALVLPPGPRPCPLP